MGRSLVRLGGGASADFPSGIRRGAVDEKRQDEAIFKIVEEITRVW